MAKLLRAVPRGSTAQISLGGPGANVKATGNAVAYAASWGVALLFGVVAYPLRLYVRSDAYAPAWGALLLAFAGANALVMWWASRPRGDFVSTLATGSAAFAGLWLLYVIGVPDISLRPFIVYALVMFVACTGSNAYLAFKGKGDGSDDKLAGVGKAVAQVREIGPVSVTEHGEVVAPFKMQPGTPAAELVPDAPIIDSLIPGMRPGATRILASRDDAGAGEMRMMPVDRLADPLPYRGPSIPWGGTADEPLRLGPRASGGWSEVYISADPEAMRNAPLIATVGESGSGKSELLAIAVLEVLSRLDTDYWYGNSRKAGQAPRWMLDGAERVATTKQQVIQMLKDVEAETAERSERIGAHGCTAWTSRCCWRKHGIRNLVIFVDEAADVASSLPEVLTNIGESIRSTGRVIWLFFQRGTGDRFPTSARSQFSGHICLGVESADDAEHGGLPEDVLALGAQPERWGARAPGMHYNATPGVPEELRAVECRTFDTRGCASMMAELAREYIEARQRGASVQDAVPEAVARVVARAPVPEAPDPVAEAARRMLDEDPEADRDEELNAIARECVPPADLAAELAAVDLSAPLPSLGPPAGDEKFGFEPRMSSTKARHRLYAYVKELAARGVQDFKVGDHIEWVADNLGYGKSWTYEAIKAFATETECGPPIVRWVGQGEPYAILPP